MIERSSSSKWKCHRLVFGAESDIAIGWHKLGFVQRTRHYIPARHFWAALTSAATRNRHSHPSDQEYSDIGKEIDNAFRFSYFYPVHWDGEDYREELPWRSTEGHESDSTDAEEMFEAKFVSSRTRTAVTAETGNAEEGALFEFEFIRARVPDAAAKSQRVYWLGYVWQRDCSDVKLDGLLAEVNIGAERRYGMGRLRRVCFKEWNASVFGATVAYEPRGPILTFNANDFLYAHLKVKGCCAKLSGDLEFFAGRATKDKWPGRDFEGSGLCWAPGTVACERLSAAVGEWGVLVCSA